MRVLGLDILPDRNHFFAVIIDGNKNEIIFRGIIERNAIYGLIRDYNVDTVAIDNIFELYDSVNEIIEFIEKTEVTLIQVTGPSFRQQSLPNLAKQYGLSSSKKLNPAAAAEIAAKLALLNVGAQVLPFRTATLVTISKSRRFGHVGGSHQQQYLRSAQAKIKTVVNRIIDLLRENNIPYDILIREGEGGYRSAKIICYADINTVKSVIKEKITDWYQIRIEPIRHNKIEFITLTTSPHVEYTSRYIIVGVDPGETTGVAILDLHGTVLYVGSRRGLGFFDLIDKIYEYGRPLIISTDVPRIPHFVHSLSQKSGAVIFRPKVLLSVSRKNEIVRNLKIKVDDSHQRDALVAAFLAYKHFERKFSKVDSIVRYIPFIDADKVKADIVLKNIDIKTAILKQLVKIIDHKSSKKASYNYREYQLQKELEALRKKYLEYKNQIEKLLSENKELKKTIAQQQQLIETLRQEVESLRKQQIDDTKQRLLLKDELVSKLASENELLRSTIQQLENKIQFLQDQVELLKRIATSDIKDIIVKKIDTLDTINLETWNSLYGITNRDLLLVRKVRYSPDMKDYLERILGIILWDPELIDDYTFSRLIQTTRVFYYEDFKDIINPDQLIQTVRITDLKKRIRRILAEYFDDTEKLYEEFLSVLEEYRKKRREVFLNY